MNIWEDLREDNLDGEIWKPVIGYEGYYEISNFARVKSLDRYIKCNDKFLRKINGRYLRNGKCTNEYLFFNLNKNRIKKNFLAHRLVAMYFIPNPENKPQVNHKDGDKSNNHVSNLEWCTPKENVRHAIENNLVSNLKGKNNPLYGRGGKDHYNYGNKSPFYGKRGYDHHASKEVILSDTSNKELRFGSAILASEFLGVSATYICTCIKESKICRGYKVFRI